MISSVPFLFSKMLGFPSEFFRLLLSFRDQVVSDYAWILLVNFVISNWNKEVYNKYIFDKFAFYKETPNKWQFLHLCRLRTFLSMSLSLLLVSISSFWIAVVCAAFETVDKILDDTTFGSLINESSKVSVRSFSFNWEPGAKTSSKNVFASSDCSTFSNRLLFL